MSAFRQAVNEAMRWLASREDTIFVGQSVCYDGAAIYDSLDGVPMEKRLEMPVIEDFQMGYCTGLALGGKLPVCVYPRMDFMLLCMNQLVAHLDKMPAFGYRPRVIIRTTLGTNNVLNAGPQHTQDHVEAFRMMLKNVRVLKVWNPTGVMYAYREAVEYEGSTLIVEAG